MQRDHAYLGANPVSFGASLHAAQPPPVESGSPLHALEAELQRGRSAERHDGAASGADAVELGSTVEFRDLRTNEIEEYTVVHPDKADILLNRVSSFTPIGRALFGRRVGEVVEFDAPGGTVHVRIESIRTDNEA